MASSSIYSTTRLLFHGLSDVCERVSVLCDPAFDHVVLHKRQCRKLASSYRVALQHLEARILEAEDHQNIHGRLPDRSDAKEVVVLSFRAMLQAMRRGEQFVRDCSGAAHTWLLKAVGGLALSTEAVHIHLHDLMWCIYIVIMAVELVLDGSNSMTRSYQSFQDLPGWQCSSSIVAAIAEIWEHDNLNMGLVDSADEDLRSVLQVLSKLRADHNIDANNAYLADFLWKRLSDYMMHHNHFAHSDDIELPESLWIDVATAGLRQHIHDVVGEGAFAKVSKVEWLGGKFAMKDFFHVNKVQFGKEAAIQARLQHPNVLQLICCASGPNRCSLMMELMQEDLLSFMNNRTAAGKDPPFSLLEALDIMLQISKGMEHVHNLNVLHRDLKSNNILVGTGSCSYYDEDTDPVVQVKVADFGMAKAKQSSFISSSRVQRGATRWRAPEVFFNEPEGDDDDDGGAEQQDIKLPKIGKYTKKADVYSFGMVCYEILTGKLPFATSKLTILYRTLMAGDRPTLPERCPAALASLIRRCWHGDPLQRPLFPEISRTLLYFKANLVLTNQTDVTISTSPAFLPTLLRVISSLDKTRAAAPYYTSRSLHIVKEMYQCTLEDLLYKHSAQEIRPTPSYLRPVMEEAGELTLSDESAGKKKSATQAAAMQKRSVCGFLARFFCWEGGAAKRPGTGAGSFLEQAREFSYPELELATRNFSSLLGSGGISKAYWGKLPDGQEIAVKRLIGDASRYRELFLRELNILGSLRHPNLVPLLGWCIVGGPFLVYEFLPNGNLSTHLRVGSNSRLSDHDQAIMAWEKRYRIVCQLASVLHYLHHGSKYTTIVHGDVKPANVLLDTHWNARLDDCGLALILDRHEASREGELSGTPGFLDPYAWHKGVFGASSDVYAFGVTALMVATGEPAVKISGWREGRQSAPVFLRDWVYELYEKGGLLDAADSRLQKRRFQEEQMRRLLVVGLACSAYNPVRRPTMQLVVDVLKGTSSYDLQLVHNVLANEGVRPMSYWDQDSGVDHLGTPQTPLRLNDAVVRSEGEAEPHRMRSEDEDSKSN